MKNLTKKIYGRFVSAVWEANRLIVSRSKDKSVLTVCEYPKGGGTWIAKMCATSLGLPYVGNGLFMPLVPCVIRTHWYPDERLSPCLIVVRDVRDVMVSLFHHRIRNMQNTPLRAKQYLAKLGVPLNAELIREQLHGFMEVEFDNPRYGAHQNWPDFIKHSMALASDEGNNVELIRYEDALLKPAESLFDVLTKLKKHVLVEHAQIAAELHNSKWGNAQSANLKESTFLRSATAGGWRASFSSESASFIAKRCNKQLLDLGYEHDEDWWRAI